MSINIQELVNFEVDGLNDLLTESQKQELLSYQKQLEEFRTKLDEVERQLDSVMNNTPTVSFRKYSRKLLAVDVDYTLPQKAKIFLHGKSGYKIWFLNRANKLCVVDKTKIADDNLYLTVVIDVKKNKTETSMSLNTFLYLVEVGDFKITNEKFVQYYLKPYQESNHVKMLLQQLNSQKANLEESIAAIVNNSLYKKIETLYDKKQKELLAEYKNSTKDLCRDVEAEKAKNKKAKCEKAQATIKNLWDSMVTDADKAYFVGWLCSHVDSIYIKVVEGGVSDKVISTSYPDKIYGKKYREKSNSSGWDAASGKIRFTNVSNAPISTIQALSTAKHIARSSNNGAVTFKDKALSNLDLCLFILGKYQKYGFFSGVRNLHKIISYKTIRDECFINYCDEFMKGYYEV